MVNRFDKNFRYYIEAISPSVVQAMKNRDLDALNGLQSFQSFYKFPALNTASKILSFIYRETSKKFEMTEDMPKISQTSILKSLVNVRNNIILDTIDSFIEAGLLKKIETPIKSLQVENAKKVEYELEPVWRISLSNYNKNLEQEELFTNIIARLVYCSYRAKREESSALHIIKLIMILIKNKNEDDELPESEIENTCNNIGKARWSEILMEQSQVKSNIRFIEKGKDGYFKINKNAIYAFNKYIVPNYNKIYQKNPIIFGRK